ncbi:hypothetical protein ATY77_21025 [Rhizobium sp. R634]|uniref:NAD(+)--rifampin ADP-ribosyltransferase n=1 Tax=Rhizobium sp. R634 TaxID=1764274 RepID=UPI000B71D9CD|nr:NAD(+)--rifampin ADP-ribosyltransferase [Rhizobium sp. R634]OWV69650.1 hypothetical protein ATY77_21025 [Rhizobium sp. R634]
MIFQRVEGLAARGANPPLTTPSIRQKKEKFISHADSNTPAQPFLHGTKADLKPGDMIKMGYKSSFTTAKPLSWVYFTSTIEAATWGAELAAGDGRGRIYIVEPTGTFEDDPNLTTGSFR